ncbi:unnamed protein product, partial [Discosporangium mesarthrocarpum]
GAVNNGSFRDRVRFGVWSGVRAQARVRVRVCTLCHMADHWQLRRGYQVPLSTPHSSRALLLCGDIFAARVAPELCWGIVYTSDTSTVLLLCDEHPQQGMMPSPRQAAGHMITVDILC